jgi:hypothetical protein
MCNDDVDKSLVIEDRLLTIEETGFGYRAVLHRTGEIRECKTLEPLLKSLMRDHGYYLRKVSKDA